jgi:hypothetical protein
MHFYQLSTPKELAAAMPDVWALLRYVVAAQR